jgi:hypothetical protein
VQTKGQTVLIRQLIDKESNIAASKKISSMKIIAKTVNTPHRPGKNYKVDWTTEKPGAPSSSYCLPTHHLQQ